MTGLFIFIIAIGVWFVLSAVLNWEWYHAFWEVQAEQALFGETFARWSFGPRRRRPTVWKRPSPGGRKPRP